MKMTTAIKILRAILIALFLLMGTGRIMAQQKIRYVGTKSIDKDGVQRKLNRAEYYEFNGDFVYDNGGFSYKYHHSENGNKIYYLWSTNEDFSNMDPFNYQRKYKTDYCSQHVLVFSSDYKLLNEIWQNETGERINTNVFEQRDQEKIGEMYR